MRPAAVFIHEIEAREEPAFSGEFEARLEPDPWTVAERFHAQSIDAAIDWGRARAAFVLVRFGRRRDYWSAGITPHWAYPRWPPSDVPPLERRAVPEANWHDREPDSPPLIWSVSAELTPHANLFESRVADEAKGKWDELVALAAATSQAGWESTEIDAFLADMDSQRGQDGWHTTSRPIYVVSLLETAVTHTQARDQAAARFPAPDEFGLVYRVRPADLDEAEAVES